MKFRIKGKVIDNKATDKKEKLLQLGRDPNKKVVESNGK